MCVHVDVVSVLKKVRTAPLPSYTGQAQVQLQAGEPELCWSKIVGQTADFYFGLCPTIGDASHYKEIGEKVYRAFPCIQHSGNKPWVCSCQLLT